MTDYETPRLRRHHHRRRRRRPAGRHRGPGRGPAHRAGLQVAARQGAHRHGRGRHGRRPGQRVRPRTTGRSTSATPCAAARCSTTGGWPSSTPRRRPTGSASSSDWGALFDRTADGRILQRDFGGHRYARLAHVGDRTGLELIRTLQQKAVADGHRRLHGVQGAPPPARRRRAASPARSATGGPTGEFVVVHAPRRSCWPPAAIGKRWKYTSNSWESDRRRPRHGALGRGRPHRHGVRAVPPDRHGLAAVGARASSSPRACAATAACCATPRASASCSTTSRRCSGPRRPTPRRRPTRWYDDHIDGRRPPELLPRDEVARAINSEVKAGRGSPHGGVFLDIATRRTAEDIRRRLPVDVPPVQGAGRRRHHRRAHGGRARPATTSWAASGSTPTPQAATVPGPLRRRRGGRRDARRQPARAATRSRTCSSSAAGPGSARPTSPRAAPARRASTAAAGRRGHRRGRSPPSSREDGENPYDVHHDLQETMQTPGRHHPHRARARGGAGQARGARGAGGQGVRSRAAAPTTRAGTWPPTCPPCSPSSTLHDPGRPQPQGEPGRPHPGRLPEARIPRWARSTSSQRSQTRPSTACLARRSSDRSPRARAAAGDARRARRTVRGGDTDGRAEIVARHRERRRSPCGSGAATTSGGEFDDYVMPAAGGRGGARRHPPDPGDPGARPGLPVELQGRQVRLVLGRDQRPAPPHVHDPHGHAARRASRSPSRRCRPSRSSATWSPTSPSTTRWPSGSPPSSPAPEARAAATGCSRSTSSAARSSASASSASCARTSAT